MAQLALKGGQPLVQGNTIGQPWPLYDDTDRQALNRVIESRKWCSVIVGKQTESEVGTFEIEFARYQDNEYGSAVTNGTTAIEVALRAGGIERGDGTGRPALQPR